MNNNQRIVLDTNCLLMSIPSKSPYHNVFMAFLRGEYVLCITNEILLEYEEIISNKTNSKIAANILNAILSRDNILFINPVYRFKLIEADPDDNKFVDGAFASQADFIVTNDNHFAELKQIDFPKIEIKTIDEFAELLASK